MKSSTSSTTTVRSPKPQVGNDNPVFLRVGDKGSLVVDDPAGVLFGRHYSQLNFWGFHCPAAEHAFVAQAASSSEAMSTLVMKLLPYFSRYGIPVSLAPEVESLYTATLRVKDELNRALKTGALLKSGHVGKAAIKDFTGFLHNSLARRLKDHQVKAALHLLAVRNGANFSVPGSGKTTVVLSVFQWLRSLGQLDSLFVVGPPSCFGPWRAEYASVIGKEPSWEILAGGDVEERRSKYYVSKQRLPDLYLTSFQTLLRDYEKVKLLFNQHHVNFALVVDEAHYIKQLGGAWATAVLSVAKYAKVRWVLTGTPFPYSFTDAFNAFDVLWPDSSPIEENARLRIQEAIKKDEPAEGAAVLESCIGPLFYRVRKNDLQLAKQDFRRPLLIHMNKYERHIYNAVQARIRTLSRGDFDRDYDLMVRLKRGRMMRLRQCLSYARLLRSAVSEYNETLVDDQLSLADTIKHYDKLEVPAKLTALLEVVERLSQKREKVVVWSNFVETLQMIRNQLQGAGHGVHLIYGAVPTEQSTTGDELTREKMIAEFSNANSAINVLVANPAACAESISLHKTCSNAVYYDISYNCGQYVQSTDRIHRVGGSENKIAHYYFLQYADTVDQDILTNVRRKAANMSRVIDQDYAIYSLDMFSQDEELEAYDRIFKRPARRTS
jgi:SNF2 family DNA or RNA helicase